MPEHESPVGRAHRLLDDDHIHVVQAPPDDVPSRLARIEALLVTVLHEVETLRAAPPVTAPASDMSR
jgi:hypothetical protein